MSDRSERDSYWLWLTSAEGVGPTTANDLWAQLRERGIGLDAFFALDPAVWAGEFKVKSRAATGLTDAKAKWNEIVERAESLRESGVALLSLEHPDYPASLRDALGRQAPPLLYAIGNLDLLRQTALAVVGARDASERGLAISRSIGEQAGRAGIVVVSGGARGIDLMAHTGAIDSGGATICVLSEGILRSNSRADLGVELDRRAALFLSELPPNMTWSIGGAMSRNRIVCALAAVVVVVEAREKGGTVDAADTALELHRPLFVVDYAATGAQNDGNRKLLRKAGARPLPVSGDESSAIGRVDLDPVLRELQSPPGAAPPAGQMDLFA